MMASGLSEFTGLSSLTSRFFTRAGIARGGSYARPAIDARPSGAISGPRILKNTRDCLIRRIATPPVGIVIFEEMASCHLHSFSQDFLPDALPTVKNERGTAQLTHR